MSTQSVTVYSKPDVLCVQCKATKRWLTKRGVEFEVFDVTEDSGALARIQEAGFKQVPVVHVIKDGEEFFWSGHMPTNLDKHFRNK